MNDDIPRNARSVCDDLVNCPLRRADTEVETCWRCPWLRKASPTGRYLVCDPPFASLPPVGIGVSRP